MSMPEYPRLLRAAPPSYSGERKRQRRQGQQPACNEKLEESIVPVGIPARDALYPAREYRREQYCEAREET
jgi:hypothetical protein